MNCPTGASVVMEGEDCSLFWNKIYIFNKKKALFFFLNVGFVLCRDCAYP